MYVEITLSYTATCVQPRHLLMQIFRYRPRVHADQQSVGGVTSVWELEADMRTETRTRGPPGYPATEAAPAGADCNVMATANSSLLDMKSFTHPPLQSFPDRRYIYLSEDYEVTIKQIHA